MSEVLFERARLRAEGGAWRDGFLYGGAAGYRNFELFEVRTAASARRAASFPATTALLDSLQVPDGPRIVGFGRQRPDSALPVHSDKATYVLTAHVPLDLLHEDDAAPEAVPGGRASLGAIAGFAAAIIGLETYGRLGVG